MEMLLKLVELFELTLGQSLALSSADFAARSSEQQLAILLERLIEAKLLPVRTNVQVTARDCARI
jgi:hypothetical protein